MRILVVSDIHANWPALAAIDEPHDLCLCLGDLVDYGPDPAPCVRCRSECMQEAVEDRVGGAALRRRNPVADQPRRSLAQVAGVPFFLDACQSTLFKPVLFNFAGPPSPARVEHVVKIAVRTFLAAYRAR